jgi:isopentenyl-diphosphate delta-isomerase
MSVTENMLIDVVNEADAPIGQVSRRDVFRLHANFRVVHVLVFNSTGALLIQRLAATRPRHAGYWGSSVAGYLHLKERYDGAAQRRVAEELGERDAKLHKVGKIAMEDDGCTKFIEVYTTLLNGPFRFDHRHIDELEFLPIPVIQWLHASKERNFTPTFLDVLAFYLKKQTQS